MITEGNKQKGRATLDDPIALCVEEIIKALNRKGSGPFLLVKNL
jgi:hypothetical protein